MDAGTSDTDNASGTAAESAPARDPGLADRRLAELLSLADRAAATALTGAYEPVGRALRKSPDDLVPATRQLLAAGRLIDAMRMVTGLHFFWQDSARTEDGQALAEAALAASDGVPTLDPGLRARTMLTAGEMAFRRGDQQAASRWSEAAVGIAAGAGDASTAALAEVSLARVAFRDGDAERIERYSRLALDRAGTDPKVQRAAYHMLAWAAYTAGDRDGALDWFERSLAVRRSMDDPFGVAVELASMGEMSMEAHDIVRAARLLHEATTIAIRLENVYLLASLIGSAGALAVEAGDAERGVTLLAAADSAYASTALVPDPGTRDMIDAALARARVALGSEMSGANESQGRALSFEDAFIAAESTFDRLRSH